MVSVVMRFSERGEREREGVQLEFILSADPPPLLFRRWAGKTYDITDFLDEHPGGSRVPYQLLR